MAYMKYKELTQYFNFSEELDATDLPKYVTDYIAKGERILGAYKTKRDKGIFTDKRAILFDQKDIFGNTKEITVIPYSSISSLSIKFGGSIVNMFLYMDSGYPLRLRFIMVNPEYKTRLRLVFTEISKLVVEKNT